MTDIRVGAPAGGEASGDLPQPARLHIRATPPVHIPQRDRADSSQASGAGTEVHVEAKVAAGRNV